MFGFNFWIIKYDLWTGAGEDRTRRKQKHSHCELTHNATQRIYSNHRGRPDAHIAHSVLKTK